MDRETENNEEDIEKRYRDQANNTKDIRDINKDKKTR